MKIHFIGIGGIGVSALARYYLAKGCKISGSDLASSEIIDALRKLGAKINIGEHKAVNIPKSTNLVIYSPAVKASNPEFMEAQKRKIKLQSYPEALGELTRQYFTIAVSGTHGKSTTTSMIGLLLTKAGFNPTVIVGTKVKEFGDGSISSPQGSNFRTGGKPDTKYRTPNTKYLVIEADEHMASFLNYWPEIIVLTNIEADHLDYYKNLGNILKTFKKYVGHLPKDGLLVANGDDKNIYQLTENKKQKTLFYSLKQPEAKKLKKTLKIPGEHNISNALAALAVARILKIPDKISLRALSGYRGSWRRFEISTKYLGAKRYTLISDYGHHPTEVKVTLKAAREKYPGKKIWCVFQPHQYQRTYYLFSDFVEVFKRAPIDNIIITDIYDVAGRETPEIKKRVSAEKLVKKINKKNVIYIPKAKIIDSLKKNLKSGEILVIMGAGDIYNLSLKLAE